MTQKTRIQKIQTEVERSALRNAEALLPPLRERLERILSDDELKQVGECFKYEISLTALPDGLRAKVEADSDALFILTQLTELLALLYRLAH